MVAAVATCAAAGIEVLPKAQHSFLLLTSPRSGSEWIMNNLNGHPSICSSPSSDQIGYPTEALIPHSAFHSGVPDTNINKGCFYAFVRDSVNEIAHNSTLSAACTSKTMQNIVMLEQPWTTHFIRLCNIYHALANNYSNPNIFLKWSEAFLHENTTFLGCSCKPGTCVKGLKVMTNWIRKQEYSSMIRGFVSGLKVIRLERKNLFQRYKSFLTASQTGVWHIRSVLPNTTTTNAIMAPSITIDVKEMIRDMKTMESNDKYANKEILEWDGNVMWLTYEDCKTSPEECFNKMGRFLGVLTRKDFKWIDGNVDTLQRTSQGGSLSGIENKDEVAHALAINGWAGFLIDETHHSFNRTDFFNRSGGQRFNENSIIIENQYIMERMDSSYLINLMLVLLFVTVVKLKMVERKGNKRGGSLVQFNRVTCSRPKPKIRESPSAASFPAASFPA